MTLSHTSQPQLNLIADALMSETEVLARWPALSKSRLRVARGRGQIVWVKGKRGSAWYRPTAVEHFIKMELEQPCLVGETNHFLKSGVTGSLENQADQVSIIIGMTPELEERAVQNLARKISKKPNKSSRA